MFNTVRLSMTLFFPFAISQWGEMRVSISRIQDFLVLEEREEREGVQEEKEGGGVVALKEVTGKWRREETEDTLNGITMEVRMILICLYFKLYFHFCVFLFLLIPHSTHY